ncbi:Hint domain-containing protein [Leptobacterium sp. I13]|uniref:Hint domain-containing protein n=1 Tax=Leptobacterium meishanense TaxID=3128904 RepID=UPI0030EF7068
MKINDQEKELFNYIDSIIPESGQLEYDFNDPKQFEFALMFAQKSFDTERYPGIIESLHVKKRAQEQRKVVKNTLETDTGFQNMFGIPGVGLDSTTRNVASNGIGTIVGGYASMSLLLFIKDNATGNIITHAANNDMAGTLLSVATSPNSGTANLDVTSYLSYSGTPKKAQNQLEDPTPISGIAKRGAYNTTADPTISAPVRTTSNPRIPTAINIGLGRPWTDQGGTSGFDYAWNEPTSSSPIGKIPFVGSVVFNQAIQTLTPNSNFLLQIYVANQVNGGTVTLNVTDMATVYSRFSIDPANPNKLNWNLPAGISTSDPGNPIVFQHITWPTDMEALFYCQIIVTLADGSLGSANVQSQLTSDDDPLDGTLGIMPIAFIWHCLGEDTVVDMAEGGSKPIADIVAGDFVKTDFNGGTAKVEWTNKGMHIGGALKICLENTVEITTSDNHVFFTNNKPTPASELKEGDPLITKEGPVKITAIETIRDFKGMFYNIATRPYERPEDFNGIIGSFIANGVKTGDVNAQKAYRHMLSNDKEWVKKQIPSYLYKDLDSFFEDKK